jgi:hypothetical protein
MARDDSETVTATTGTRGEVVNGEGGAEWSVRVRGTDASRR